MRDSKQTMQTSIKARCSIETRTKLEKEAKKQNRDLSNLVRIIVENWLKRNSYRIDRLPPHKY